MVAWFGACFITLFEPLIRKPGIFGGLVVVWSWKRFRLRPQSEISEITVLTSTGEITPDERNIRTPFEVTLGIRQLPADSAR